MKNIRELKIAKNSMVVGVRIQSKSLVNSIERIKRAATEAADAESILDKIKVSFVRGSRVLKPDAGKVFVEVGLVWIDRVTGLPTEKRVLKPKSIPEHIYREFGMEVKS